MMRWLCLITLVGLLAVAGCSSIGAVRSAIFGDPSIDGADKVAYATLVEEKEAEFRRYREENKAFMPFHYSSIVLVVGGLVLAMLGKTTKDEGAIAVLSGLALSSWGFLAPKYVAIPMAVLGGFAIILVAIVVDEVFLKARRKSAG